MIFQKIKRSIESIVFAASIALTPAISNAYSNEKELMHGKPSHIQWIVDNKSKARAMVFGFDVIFGCLKSGIGSRLNSSGFWNGCAKGALGGTVMYTGEHIATYNYQYPMAGAVGKLVHDLGVSMSDNVMRGEDMFSRYETDFGPVNFTFSDSYVPHLSFTLTPIMAIASNLSAKQSFDAKQSLYNLTPVFQKPMEYDGLGSVPGYTQANVISYTPRQDLNKLTFTHEFNHALFWSKFRFSKDLVQWVPTEKIHPSLEMEKVQRWWNIGQDIGGNLFYLPYTVNEGMYHYQLPELEAYIMQRL